MFRSAVAWILTTAFLMTLPVAGVGYCPCRFAEALRGQAPTANLVPFATALPQPCKGCRHAHQDNPPAHAGDDRLWSSQPPCAPSEAPCDHRCVLDAAPACGSGERSGAERGVWGADAVSGTGGQSNSNLTRSFTASSNWQISSSPTARHLLRYAHAFRC